LSTSPTPPLSICSIHIGPVMSMDGRLSKQNQNLIFARNGTGKSFLSRALRYLDIHGQNNDISNAAERLVSDESPNGAGEFYLKRDTEIIGSLKLQKEGHIAEATIGENTILHVFNEDFVQEELRERSYEIDGDIEHEIAINQENIQLTEAQEERERLQRSEREAKINLTQRLKQEKQQKLHGKGGVNKKLTEYQRITLDHLLNAFSEKPELPSRSSILLLEDLDKLKSIPAEPDFPEDIILGNTFDLSILPTLQDSLEKITSPSSVAEIIKNKIGHDHEFYYRGVTIVQSTDTDSCPFCEQNISAADPKSVVDSYLAYFSDEEEKHKAQLRNILKALQNTNTEIDHLRIKISNQKRRFDKLKAYIPSQKEVELDDCADSLDRFAKSLADIEKKVFEKMGNLTVSICPENLDVSEYSEMVAEQVGQNNEKASRLKNAMEQLDEERRYLQRKLCRAFEKEFVIQQWEELENIRQLRIAVGIKESEITAIEQANPSRQARERVADTFELLLLSLFANKYTFDRVRFTLKRGENEMSRGPNRTLSEGEKTAIAFCYFVACVHLKVETEADYHRIFMVFDDPVTSMSYDFVFSIAQILKSLSLSNTGAISINPSVIDGNVIIRPRLIILTHSSYFFNILLTNKVVKADAAFSLENTGDIHNIVPLKEYMAPFQHQLREIYDISIGTKQPDYSTGNSIRSVLEAVGRFCRPDKCKFLSDFLIFLAGEGNIVLQSVLINNLSHGTFYEETPSPSDLKLACQEAIDIVEHYAKGQLEIIKSV
jgi:wobble nucleotide-excising tRNase